MRRVLDSTTHARTRWLLLASILLSVPLLTASVREGRVGGAFLVWNLVLAWVPYVTAQWLRLLARRSTPGRGLLVLPTAFWLLFFPNAPYVVTDLIHVRELPSVFLVPGALWITFFAALAMLLGLLSLRDMHGVVQGRLGVAWGRTFALTCSFLGGLGVAMGRFLRWNSWDAITRPAAVVGSTWARLTSDVGFLGWALLFGALLSVLYFKTAGALGRIGPSSPSTARRRGVREVLSVPTVRPARAGAVALSADRRA